MATAPLKLNSLEPRATEKTYFAQTLRTYAFFVDKNETKQSIAKKVEKDFNVTVTDVRVLRRQNSRFRNRRGE